MLRTRTGADFIAMTRPSISLLLPTRGRPALVERLFRSIVDNTSHLERIEVILYVDDDDIGSHELGSEHLQVHRIIGPPMSMGGYNSTCLVQAQGDIIMLANDDMVIGTPGWDDQLMKMDAEFPDKIYLSYGNDLNKGRGLCTFPILSRRTCELLVEPYPEAYGGAFIDVHLFDIFKRLLHEGFDRIRYLDDVIFEHLHFRNGKAKCDDTYAKRGRFEDDSTFIAMKSVRSAGVKRILNALRGEPLTVYEQIAHDKYEPPGITNALKHFSRQLLFDKELPLGWRGYLWYRFLGRHLAKRGLLWPFVR
jgi:hypothetical protein